MSKIICDVCGTTYTATSAQCPICGCVNSGEKPAGRNNAGINAADGRHYTHVKGGRFSKSNVKKRSNSGQFSANPAPSRSKKQDKNATDKVLTAVIIILLLAIIAVVLYIVFRFLNVGLPQASQSGPVNPSQSTTQGTVPSTTQPITQAPETTEPSEILCTSLSMDSTSIYLAKVGAATLLNVYPEPANTTEIMTYFSSNESVATVTESGKVVAVGSGTAQITIICGSAQLVCTVDCATEELGETTVPTTEPTTEPTTQPTTEPQVTFELNRSDFTLSKKGDSWVLYSGSLPRTEITWKSDDEDIATVDNGNVVAVGPGTTTVRAEYKGIERTCTVRCTFAEETTTPTEGSGNSGGNASGSYTISHTDVTIKVGETFTLTLKDSNGNTVSVAWITSNSNCSVSGNTVTGLASGETKVYAPYDGREYACIVRVK